MNFHEKTIKQKKKFFFPHFSLFNQDLLSFLLTRCISQGIQLPLMFWGPATFNLALEPFSNSLSQNQEDGNLTKLP